MRGYLPDWLISVAKPIYRKLNNKNIEIGLKNNRWYDNAYKNTPAYHVHYTDSNYYFIWNVIMDRIKRFNANSIIDLGCGSGQFGSLLFDNGIKNYLGIDFSEEAIKIARTVCPYYKFKHLDLTKNNILLTYSYDCVVTLEFLEHIEFDLEVLRQIKTGSKVFATVPNFPYVSHVRHFKNEMEVINRYKHLFSDLTVDSFIENSKGKTFFLLEGKKL